MGEFMNMNKGIVNIDFYKVFFFGDFYKVLYIFQNIYQSIMK